MKRLLLACSIVVLFTTAFAAQWGQWGRLRYAPPRFPDKTSFDGTFNFCRGMYDSDRREPGGMGWWTDYPDADINFSIRLSELTKTRVGRQSNGEPNHLVVRLTDDALFNCPWIEMEDVGTMRLTDVEVKRLREYLLKGGFLYVDDFWGEWAWQQWEEEIGRVLDPREYPVRDIPLDHQLFRTMFVIGPGRLGNAGCTGPRVTYEPYCARSPRMVLIGTPLVIVLERRILK